MDSKVIRIVAVRGTQDLDLHVRPSDPPATSLFRVLRVQKVFSSLGH